MRKSFKLKDLLRKGVIYKNKLSKDLPKPDLPKLDYPFKYYLVDYFNNLAKMVSYTGLQSYQGFCTGSSMCRDWS